VHRITPILLAALLAATAALAHSGVKDPQVKARMEGMGVLGAQTKIVSQMAKGTAPFDAAKARTAIELMQAETQRVPALFEAEADDPKSEAKPAIWTDWAAFTARTDALSNALDAADVTSPDALNATLRKIGTTCGGCHQQFRE